MATIAGAGPGGQQVPKYLGHLPWLSPGHQQGAALEVKQPGIEQVPIRDVSIIGSGLTCQPQDSCAMSVLPIVPHA